MFVCGGSGDWGGGGAPEERRRRLLTPQIRVCGPPSGPPLLRIVSAAAGSAVFKFSEFDVT